MTFKNFAHKWKQTLLWQSDGNVFQSEAFTPLGESVNNGLGLVDGLLTDSDPFGRNGNRELLPSFGDETAKVVEAVLKACGSDNQGRNAAPELPQHMANDLGQIDQTYQQNMLVGMTFIVCQGRLASEMNIPEATPLKDVSVIPLKGSQNLPSLAIREIRVVAYGRFQDGITIIAGTQDFPMKTEKDLSEHKLVGWLHAVGICGKDLPQQIFIGISHFFDGCPPGQEARCVVGQRPMTGVKCFGKASDGNHLRREEDKFSVRG
jgi:hypothetical protein